MNEGALSPAIKEMCDNIVRDVDAALKSGGGIICLHKKPGSFKMDANVHVLETVQPWAIAKALEDMAGKLRKLEHPKGTIH